MRQINLNGVYYPIHSDIIQRRINPWKAKLGGGSLEYSDFSQAEMEEYFDFRNGIGKKRGVGSDARLDWSDGIDFSVEGQAVLGPKVNTADYATWAANTAYVLLNFRIPTTANGYVYECTTAGTSHAATEPTWPTTVGNTVADGTVTWTCRSYLAPIKIIDFQSNTYIIQSSRILKWDGTNIDCVDNTLASPIDAIVITDDTDEYLVVSSAVRAIYTTDGTTWNELTISWASPTGASGWTNSNLAYDENTATKAEFAKEGAGWSDYLVLTIASTYCDTVRFYATKNSNVTDVDLDVYYNGAWHDVYGGSWTSDTWVSKTLGGGYNVTSARIRFYCTNTTTFYMNEFDFNLVRFRGYLADFENRLYSITTDGKNLFYSTAKDIDSYAGTFSLTGNYGTLYRLFEGKLLADGTPTLYFCGTQGLYSLDTTNEIAYKQEVSYPPITNAGNVGIYWNANVWVSTGYGILKVAPSVATFVGPDLDDGLPTGYLGKVYDFATVNNWLVFCVNGGSTDKSSIFKRNSTLGGNLQVYTTSAVNKAISCLHYSPSSLYTNGRLWFGEGTAVKYMMFPDTTSNVKQIATYEYVNDSGYGQLPIFRKVAAIPKTALGVAAITKSCSATDYVQVYYGLNGAAPTTSLGTFITSPKPTALTFASGLGTAFYTIQFAIKLIQGATATNSPELESLMFYWLPVPTTILSWQFRIQCTDENSAETIAALEAIRDMQTLVAFYPSGDTAKTSYNVKLTQLGERIMYEEQGAKEGYLEITLEQVFIG